MAQRSRGPELELDWELGLFRAVRALWRWAAPARSAPWSDDRVVHLAEVEGRLRWLAGLIAGRPLRVLPARGTGGIRGDDLLLPPWLDLGPDRHANQGLYVLRVVVDATTAARRPSVPETAGARFVQSLAEARASVATLQTELPRFGEAWREASEALLRRPVGASRSSVRRWAERGVRDTLAGNPVAPELAERLAAASVPDDLGDPGALWGRLVAVDLADAGAPGAADDPTPSADATEVEAPAVEDIRVTALEEIEAREMPIHAFEKVEMAEAFDGTVRQLDGEDDLAAQLEALEEVALGDLLRGGPQAHSVLRADIAMNAEVPDVGRVEPGETGLATDEWNGLQRVWRRGWCHVYPTALPAGPDGGATGADLRRLRRTIDRLYDRLVIHRMRRASLGRQLDGDSIDIEALIDASASTRAGMASDGRLYVRRPRSHRDVATTVLLDVSLSADAWVAGRRVLDVARDAVLVLGEVADRLGDELQILAFASSTRHRVRVFTVLDWGESWAVGRARLGSLSPQGYTRLGAAVRHATDRLLQSSASERLLLLVTDGKPTDWDRYEGRYGVMDVGMALLQAHAAGVATHALAIDARARDHLPEMLGVGRWDVLARPEGLVESLTRAYGRLV